MCDLGNTEDYIEKYPNIIEYYDTAKKRFIAQYIFIGETFRENSISELSTTTRDDIENQQIKSREELRNLSDVVKDH